jgi:voltage-gated potassium channel Kch
MSLSFVAAAPPNRMVHSIYSRLAGWLARFESKKHHPDEVPIDLGEATILIFGLGRVGAGACDALSERHADTVLGVDADSAAVEEHRRAGRNAALGDATDPDFWERLRPEKIRLIVLAMPNHRENLMAVDRLLAGGFAGLIAATAQYDDEIAELRQRGVHAAFDLFAEAGAGLAAHVSHALDEAPGGPDPGESSHTPPASP